jgi:hypothetical protein
MPIHWTILGFVAIIATVGCSGRSSAKKDLLTHGSWRYEKAGFDDDDGSFDALNPQIAGTEKDNTIFFCRDGTGYSEFAHRRAGPPDSFPFVWSFSNDSTIYFQDQYYKVRVLTPQRLEIYVDQKLGGTSTRYTIILKR